MISGFFLMIIKGRACVIRSKKDYLRFKEGDILLAFNADPETASVIGKATAMAVEVDNRLCHAAIIAREAGKPLIMGMKGVTEEFETGDPIIVDTERKFIFKNGRAA